jgi:hypothetical protein
MIECFYVLGLAFFQGLFQALFIIISNEAVVQFLGCTGAKQNLHAFYFTEVFEVVV